MAPIPISTKINYVGTGQNGATLIGGPVKGIEIDKLASIPKGHSKIKINAQGEVFKSLLVTGHVENKGSLVFKGKIQSKIQSPEKKEKAVVESNKAGGDFVTADVTVKDLTMSFVCASYTTNGMCFGDDE